MTDLERKILNFEGVSQPGFKSWLNTSQSAKEANPLLLSRNMKMKCDDNLRNIVSTH